jgi:hypothetical protein
LNQLGPQLTPLMIDTVCDTLDMRQPDVMNHWTVPDRVGTVSRPLTSPEITLPALSVSAISCAATKIEKAN